MAEALRPHIRADEGIKRGPKDKHKRPKSPKADLGTWVIPPDLDPHQVIERYLTEATTSQIAGQYGLSRKALVKWLREVIPKQWTAVQLVRAHVKLEDGEDGIDASEDSLALARAREQTKAAQFRLTALDPDYAPKQQVSVDYSVRIDPALIGRAAELLDQMRDVTPTNSGQLIDATQQPEPDQTD